MIDPGPVGWSGGSFGDTGTCVLAPNADVMTLDGTNTWVLRDPDSSRSVVVDPGPSIDAHLDAIDAAAGDVAVVLLTHHHADHSEAAREYAERHGCGVRALDPAYRLGSEGLGEGDVVAVGGLEVHVVATPGHTVGLAVLRRAAGPGRADRRHRAGPRHDRRRAPRRPARGLPLLARAAARALRRAGDHHGVARPRPGDRRRARRPRLLPRPPPAAARAGARTPCATCTRSSGRAGRSRTRPCPARSSRSSTPTSTRCCGARRSCRCAPSWRTSQGD